MPLNPNKPNLPTAIHCDSWSRKTTCSLQPNTGTKFGERLFCLFSFWTSCLERSTFWLAHCYRHWWRLKTVIRSCVL